MSSYLFFLNASSSGGAGVDPIDIYVSQANGNDSNDGATPATAVATVSKAWSLIPRELYGPCVVHFGAGTYTWEALPVISQRTSTARVWIYGDGAGQAGEDGFTVIASDTAGAGSTTTVLITATPAATNVYHGFSIRWTSGPNVGVLRTVGRNDIVANELYPLANWASAPVLGDAFDIVEPSAVFEMPSATQGFCSGYEGLAQPIPNSLFLVNLKLTTAAAITASNLYIANSSIQTYGVHCVDVGFSAFESCNMEVANISGSTANAMGLFSDIGLGAAPNWTGWGLSNPFAQHTQAKPLYAGQRDDTYFYGYVAGERMSIVGGFVLLLNPNIIPRSGAPTNNNTQLWGGGQNVSSAYSVFASGGTAYLRNDAVNSGNTLIFGNNMMYYFSGAVFDGSLASGTSFLNVEQGNRLILRNCTVDAGACTGVRVHNGGRLSIAGTTITTDGSGANVPAGLTVHPALLAEQAATVDPEAAGTLTANTFNGNVVIREGARCITEAFTVNGLDSVDPALNLQDQGELTANGLATVISAATTTNAIVAQGLSRLRLAGGVTCTATQRALYAEGSDISFGGTCSLTGTLAGGGTVEAHDDARLIQQATSTLSIVNSNVGAAADGLRVRGGARAKLLGGANTTITANTGATGIAVNAQFGGRVDFDAAPGGTIAGVAGTDLSVGTGAGETVGVAALAASEAAVARATGGLIASNLSCIANAF